MEREDTGTGFADIGWCLDRGGCPWPYLTPPVAGAFNCSATVASQLAAGDAYGFAAASGCVYLAFYLFFATTCANFLHEGTRTDGARASANLKGGGRVKDLMTPIGLLCTRAGSR